MENKLKEIDLQFPFARIEFVENVKDFPCAGRCIIINLGEPAAVEDRILNRGSSSVFKDAMVKSGEKVVFLYPGIEDFPDGEENDLNSFILAHWTHVYQLFELESLRKVDLWRSPVFLDKNLALYLWYASPGTQCGLHNEHGFREIHTQISGIGRMQVFRNNNPDTLYHEIFMAPGNTHLPLYNTKGEYPWHQYYADTECVWLAIEEK